MASIFDFNNLWGVWGRSWEELESEDAVVGEIKLAEGKGIELFIPCGSLLEYSSIMRKSSAEQAEWVFGRLNSGRYIALRKCRVESPSIEFGPMSQNIIAEASFDSSDIFDPQATIAKVSFRLQYLDNWIGLRIDDEPPIDNWMRDRQSFQGITRLWASNDEYEITLKVGVEQRRGKAEPKLIELQQISKLIARFKEPKSYDDTEDFVQSIMLLVSFCAGWYAGLKHVEVENADGAIISVHKRFRRSPLSLMELPKPPIRYSVFDDRREELLEAWLNCKDNLKLAIREYVPVRLLKKQHYLDLEYIAASQTIEAIARAIIDAEPDRGIKYRQRIERMTVAAEQIEDSELHEWVLLQLKGKDYPALRSLMKILYDFIGPYSKTVFPKKQEFSEIQYARRNPFVHRSQKVEVLSDDYLFYHTKGLFALAQAGIMRLFGFSEDEVAILLDGQLSPDVIQRLQQGPR